ncbi:MAG: hypothetical protein H0V54_09865 [Chthoniobacterales bacterium]|nr:hypothetical protein [Chthoniobacterales bacterium]
MKTKSTSRSAFFNPRALIGFVVLLLIPQAGSAQTQNPAKVDYNAVRDFSIVSNPNGVWSYGWLASLGSPLNYYTVTDTTSVPGISAWLESGTYSINPPYVAHNDTGNVICLVTFCVPPTYLHVHPGPNNEVTVVRWTAPMSGDFYVQGAVVGLDNVVITTTTFYAVLNSTEHVFRATINSYNSPVSFHRLLTMSAGDTLDFAVDFGQNGNYGGDSTGIQFKVTRIK